MLSPVSYHAAMMHIFRKLVERKKAEASGKIAEAVAKWEKAEQEMMKTHKMRITAFADLYREAQEIKDPKIRKLIVSSLRRDFLQPIISKTPPAPPPRL